MKNKKRFVPWLIAAVIIAAFAVIGKKLYDLMFGGSLAVTTEDLKNGIIACSPAIIFIVVVLIAALIVVVAAGKLKQPKRALVRAQAPIAILLAITLSVNWVILGVEYSVVNSVFAEDVKVSDETMASGRAIADQIASEGIVLLKNDDKALPLSAGTKLNLFGWSSVRPLYGGTGSGDSDTSNAVSLIDGLKHAGFEVNEELVKFYENFRTERPVGTIRLREIGSKRGDFTVPEPTIAEYENANIFEDAFHRIRDGYEDRMLCGGSESCISPLGVGGFASMKALCTADDPARASIPFDARRSGFVMGEGSGVLLLEELETAKERGAKIYAEVVGYGANCDAYHFTAPAPGGAGGASCMRLALADGGVEPEQIGYINAHGTSTHLNDSCETAAIKSVFGSHAYELAVSSTKSMTGHLLGGAGGVEGVFTVLALHDAFLPATVNLQEPDPELDLDYSPNQGRALQVDYAMSDSLGFGGHNACVVFKRWEE